MTNSYKLKYLFSGTGDYGKAIAYPNCGMIASRTIENSKY